MSDYKLVNPYIEGTFKNNFKGDSPLDAAQKSWNELSQYIYDKLPQFAFTLKDKAGKLHNFIVHEVSKNEVSDQVKYKLEQIGTAGKKLETVFENKIEEIKNNQAGGAPTDRKKRYRDDDDDDDEDDEFDEDALYKRIRYQKMINLSQPIVYWWYTPTLYKEYINKFYMPSFVQMTPYVELELILE